MAYLADEPQPPPPAGGGAGDNHLDADLLSDIREYQGRRGWLHEQLAAKSRDPEFLQEARRHVDLQRSLAASRPSTLTGLQALVGAALDDLSPERRAQLTVTDPILIGALLAVASVGG